MNLQEIPIEVFTDHLLPNLPVRDLLNLTCTNKFFAVLCTDETFWMRKLEQDYNFTGAGTARTSGWKFIYRGLFHPRSAFFTLQSAQLLWSDHLTSITLQFMYGGTFNPT